MKKMSIFLLCILCICSIGFSKMNPRIEKLNTELKSYFEGIKFEKYENALKNLLKNSNLYVSYFEDEVTKKKYLDSLKYFRKINGNVESFDKIYENKIGKIIHRIYFYNYEKGVIKFEFLIYIGKTENMILEFKFDDKIQKYFKKEMKRKLTVK